MATEHLACPTCRNSEDSRYGYCVTCKGSHTRWCDCCYPARVPAVALVDADRTAVCAACKLDAELAVAFVPPAVPREVRETVRPTRMGGAA